MPQPEPADRVPTAEAGFTLLEVIVALAVLATTMAAVFGAVSAGTGVIATASGHANALLLARSVLDATIADASSLEGGASGESGIYSWRLSPRPVLDVVPPAREARASRLYELTLDVTWPPERQIRLVTRRLAPVP